MNGTVQRKYADFEEEAISLAHLTIEILSEENSPKPILNPKIIIKVSPEAISSESTDKILQTAHYLAANKGAVYFVNMFHKSNQISAFSTTGMKIESDATEDWETDTLRTAS